MAIESLFGVSPESLQAQRAAEQRQQAMQFAQLSPGQASQFMAYQAGSGLGGALGGMMGAKDPELEKAAQVKSLIEGVDFEDLDSVMSTINKLNKAGFTREAMSLIPRVDKLRDAEANREIKREEMKSRAEVAALKGTSKDPSLTGEERMSKFIAEVNDKLDRKESVPKKDIEQAKLYREVLLKNKTYVDKETGAVVSASQRNIPEIGTSTSGGVDSSVSVRQTPASMKAAEKVAKSKAQEDILYKNDIANVDKAIGIIDKSGRWAAGMGSVLSILPETPAAELEQAIGSIDSAKLIQTVMALKGSGPTGATGFGSLTNQEGERLVNRINSLKQKQSPAKLKENLQELKTLWAKMHGDTSVGQPSEAPATPTTTPSAGGARERNLQKFMQANPSMSKEQAVNFLKSKGFY